MPRLFILLLVALSFTFTASSQDRHQKLDLTEEQKPKVHAIDSVFLKGIAQLKNSSQSKLSKYKKLKSLSNEKDKQMKAVLTKEQFKIYKEEQEQRKKEIKARRSAS